MAEGSVGGEGFAVDASVIKADASRGRRVSGEEFPHGDLDRARGSRAVREYLEALDDPGEPSTRKSVSLTDPAASWTAAPGGLAFFAYSTNYLVDVKAGIVLDVEATAAHKTQEVDATKKIRPDQLSGTARRATTPVDRGSYCSALSSARRAAGPSIIARVVERLPRRTS